jgi:hypothetical protein
VLIKESEEHASDHQSILNATITSAIGHGIQDIKIIQQKEVPVAVKELRSKSSLIEEHKPRPHILHKTKGMTNRHRVPERSKSPS